MIRVKKESEKAGFKLIFKNLRLWHPVPSIYGKYKGKRRSHDRFYFLGSKITADSDCSHELKRCLFLGRKPMTNLDSILKIRDVTCQ